MENTLKEKTLSSLASSYFMQFAQQGIQIAMRLILARILFPQDFGLFALAFLILNIAKVFLQFGQGQYVIREKNINFNALFFLEFVSGVFVFLVCQFAAELLYKYNPAVVPLHKILCFALIPYSLTIVPAVYAQKELEFNKLILPNLLYNITFCVTTVALALKGFGAFSFVYSEIISEIMLALLLWIVFHKKINLKFSFSLREIGNLIFKAKYFYVLSIFGVFSSGIDRVILGKMVSLEAIGYYTLAMTLAMYPTEIIESALNNVFYPFFAKIKDDLARTKRFYEAATIILYWIEIPLYLFLSFNADIIVSIIFGSRWLPAVIFFRWLAIIPITRPCSTFGFHIMQAHSKENIQFFLSVAQFLLFAAAGFLCVAKAGVLGIIWAQFLVWPITLFSLYFINKITKNAVAILFKLLPVYIFCGAGLWIICALFKGKLVFFIISSVYILFFYIAYYFLTIRKIISNNFQDTAFFKFGLKNMNKAKAI